KSGDQSAPKTDKPHFMPRPKRANRCNDLPSLLKGSSNDPVEHSSTEIAPVQGYISDEHETDEDVPCRDHKKLRLTPGNACLVLLLWNRDFIGTMGDLESSQVEKEHT